MPRLEGYVELAGTGAMFSTFGWGNLFVGSVIVGDDEHQAFINAISEGRSVFLPYQGGVANRFKVVMTAADVLVWDTAVGATADCVIEFIPLNDMALMAAKVWAPL